MRYPPAETAEKHVRILDQASRLFRKRGFSGVSVAEIMKATGLTHGPFYNHFASKEALMAESMDHASKIALASMEDAGTTPTGMAEFVRGYLSEQHRDTPENGCLMAALAAEIAREKGNEPLRSSLTRHVDLTARKLAALFPWRRKAQARGESIRMLSAMVGALVLARAVDDPKLSEEIMNEVRESISDFEKKPT